MVFAEGLAYPTIEFTCDRQLARSYFWRHRNSAAFNAYELRKLWLDPPPFRPVLSSRLYLFPKDSEGKSAKIALANGMQLVVPDLGVFFEIVQRSVLQGPAGEYIERCRTLISDMGLP